MAQKVILGIQRATLYSPNHVGNDEAIFLKVKENLEAAGCKVDTVQESERTLLELDNLFGYDAVFGMARSRSWLGLLKWAAQKGIAVVNSAEGIENCTRENMTRLLISNGVEHPESLILSTSEAPDDSLLEGYEPCWVKRADFHAIHKEDVAYVRSREELKELLVEFRYRGIERVVVNRHLQGDLVKFYGVEGTDFFHWFYPFESNHTKFNLEAINGAPQGIAFSLSELRQTCSKAARALGVDVYGGDAIIGKDGVARLIDFNDWPSFAPCRIDAAKAIASLILKKIENK